MDNFGNFENLIPDPVERLGQNDELANQAAEFSSRTAYKGVILSSLFLMICCLNII